MIRWFAIGWCIVMAASAACIAGEAAVGSISGSVVDVETEGVEGAEITVVEDSILARAGLKDEAMLKTFSAAEGKYAFSLPAGKYILRVRDVSGELLGEVRTGIAVKAGETTAASVALMRGVTAIGTCMLDDKPAEGVQVTALYDGYPGEGTRTDAEGNYMMRVRPPRVSVLFRYPAIGDASRPGSPVLAQGSYTPVVTQQLVINTNVDSSTLADLHLKGLDQNTCRDVKAVLQDKTGVAFIVPRGTALTGEVLKRKGPFDTLIWYGILPGEYTIHVFDAAGAAITHQPCVLKPGKNEVTLNPLK